MVRHTLLEVVSMSLGRLPSITVIIIGIFMLSHHLYLYLVRMR